MEITLNRIPVCEILCYIKIKEECKGNIIRTSNLKAVIGTFLKTLGIGKDLKQKMRTRDQVYLVINDLIDMNLIKRLDATRYAILNSNCTKRLKLFWY